MRKDNEDHDISKPTGRFANSPPPPTSGEEHECLVRSIRTEAYSSHQIPALKSHLHDLISNYGHTYLVNLVNHKGHELPIKEAFERNMVKAASDDGVITEKAHYLYFDFHTECRKMRFDRISLLVDLLKEGLAGMGWFHQVQSSEQLQQQQGTVRKEQTGVVRSNCMDCLDRTNVSQSALGKWAATAQLRSVGVISEKETVEDYPEFMSMFRTGELRERICLLFSRLRPAYVSWTGCWDITRDIRTSADTPSPPAVWADHGDTVSRAYSGTGALKADYTRTGKRTKEGALHDGYKSVMRYVTNNFLDGDRQVSRDFGPPSSHI